MGTEALGARSGMAREPDCPLQLSYSADTYVVLTRSGLGLPATHWLPGREMSPPQSRLKDPKVGGTSAG